jgi:hypothetical protein
MNRDIGAAATFGLRRRRALRADALEQHAGRLVIRVLRHEFAPEGLGQEGGSKSVGEGAGGSGLGLDAVGTRGDFIYPGAMRS